MSKTTIDRAALKAAFRATLKRLRTDYVFALGVLCAIVGIGALGQTFGTALARMSYPLTLEWMEGGIVDHVRIVLAGKPLYREPSFEWTPFIYPPFYYWVCAVFMKAFGVSVFWARFVSVVSMLGCFTLIAAFVRKEGGGWRAAFIGAGLYAVTFKITGFWLDLARVDSLFFALFLGGMYLTRFGATPIAAAFSGLLLFLAFFTKQTGLVLAVPVLLAGIGLDRRRGLLTAGVFAGLSIGAVQWMDLTSDGWFRYYVFKVASQHPSAWNEWHKFLLESLWNPMPIVLGLTVVAFVSGALRGRAVIALYLGVLLVAGVHAYTGQLHDGGFSNALIPYCGTLSILGGVAVGWALSQDATTPLARRLQAAAIVAVLLQFGGLAYDQRPAVPRGRDVRTAKAMIERWRKVRAQRGEMHSFSFGYYEMLAGSEEGPHAHTMAVCDILKTQDQTRVKPLSEAMVAGMRRQHRLIERDPSFMFLPHEVRTLVSTYSVQERLFLPGEEDHAWPKIGFGCRPEEVMAPP